MQRRTSMTLKSVEECLNTRLKRQPDVSIARRAEALPLRRDMVTLLAFVRDNRVVGTQGTGNMPLKAVREVTARFVEPPPLETTIGDRTFRLRSEEELWPLYLLHILAKVGGLLRIAPARRWRLTAQGKTFLDADAMLQVSFLLAVWWHRVNWLVAFPVAGMGDALPPFFHLATLASLRSLPVATPILFEEFADEIIGKTRLTWTAQDMSFATSLLHGSISRMVISVLADFGAVERRYRKEPLGRGTISKLHTFKITPLGRTLLDAVAVTNR